MATNLKQLQTQKQKLAPKQVLHAKLLQLSTINLEQAVLKELEQNPLLEEIEQVESPEIEEVGEELNDQEIDAPLEDMYSDESLYYLSEEKKEIPLPERHTLIENLINQLSDIQLDDLQFEIGEEILWNTNERGYLDTDLVLIADRYDLLEEEVEPILKKIQRLSPKGIASRNLQECLSIQLEDNKDSLAYQIVSEYFDDFMHKRYSKILDRLACDEESLQSAIHQISNLNPRPGEGFRDKFQVVIPDVIITEDGDDWLITTNDSGVPELRISKVYEEQLKIGKFEKDAKKFIKEKVDAANWFIEAINERRVTMVNVTKTIIDFQPEWFAGDMNFLRPLKLQDIADKINMDISTISRSTRGKYVETPYGIFELKHYFTDSIELKNGKVLGTFVIKKSLEKIIEQEDKKDPLSDDLLVKKLQEVGYSLARRTIAKYRDQMGFPVARLRKEI
jgi:RNA polymerase sigma-54 factor